MEPTQNSLIQSPQEVAKNARKNSSQFSMAKLDYQPDSDSGIFLFPNVQRILLGATNPFNGSQTKYRGFIKLMNIMNITNLTNITNNKSIKIKNKWGSQRNTENYNYNLNSNLNLNLNLIQQQVMPPEAQEIRYSNGLHEHRRQSITQNQTQPFFGTNLNNANEKGTNPNNPNNPNNFNNPENAKKGSILLYNQNKQNNQNNQNKQNKERNPSRQYREISFSSKKRHQTANINFNNYTNNSFSNSKYKLSIETNSDFFKRVKPKPSLFEQKCNLLFLNQANKNKLISVLCSSIKNNQINENPYNKYKECFLKHFPNLNFDLNNSNNSNNSNYINNFQNLKNLKNFKNFKNCKNFKKSKGNDNLNFRKLIFFNSKPHSHCMNKKLTELLDTSQLQQYEQCPEVPQNDQNYMSTFKNVSSSISSITNNHRHNNETPNNNNNTNNNNVIPRIKKSNILYKRFVLNHKHQSSKSNTNQTAS